MLGLLLFLFQTIQMLKLCFKLKVKKPKQKNPTKAPNPPLTQEGQPKPVTKVKTRNFHIFMISDKKGTLLQWKWSFPIAANQWSYSESDDFQYYSITANFSHKYNCKCIR